MNNNSFYQDQLHIKLHNFIACIKVIAYIILLIFFSISSISTDVMADSPMKKLSEIKSSLKTKLKAVKEAKKKEKSLITKLDGIDSSISKRERELKGYDNDMFQTKTEIRKLSKERQILIDKLDSKKLYLKTLVMDIYKRQYNSNALILLSADDYQDLITKSRYISLIAHYDSAIISKYSSDINSLNSNKKNLEALKNKIEKNKKTAQLKKKELQADRKKKDTLLASVKAKRTMHEKKIRELEKSTKKLHSMIKGIKTKKIPDSIIGKGFKSLKGSLPWPVNGEIRIPFGKYREPEFNTIVIKNGIEIQPTSDKKPETVAGGRVVFANWFEGYGKLVIIDHGNGYHSLYSNLSEISLVQGNIVAEGFEVGSIGKSKSLNVPSLYFEIRYKGKPVNPANWLGRKI